MEVMIFSGIYSVKVKLYSQRVLLLTTSTVQQRYLKRKPDATQTNLNHNHSFQTFLLADSLHVKVTKNFF